MHFETIADDGQILSLRCQGDILQTGLPSGDLFEEMAGPSIFGRSVILDMGNVHFIGSAGMGKLLASHRRFQQGGGKLVLYQLTLEVQKTLRLVRLDVILDIAESEAEARRLVVERDDEPAGTP